LSEIINAFSIKTQLEGLILLFINYSQLEGLILLFINYSLDKLTPILKGIKIKY